MSAKGWPIGDVCTTSLVVKDFRNGEAHSTTEEKRGVTLAQLSTWAEAEAHPDVVDDCKQFLELVACFGQGGNLLVQATNVASIVMIKGEPRPATSGCR